jgi:hypothetical protein
MPQRAPDPHFADRPVDMCTIDGILFRLNPDSYECTSERLFVDVPTLRGMNRFSYGNKPSIHKLSGTTGMSGLEQIVAMERFRPRGGRSDVPSTFTYPNRFAGVRLVYINSFIDSIKSDTPLNFWYDLELEEYPNLGPGYTTVPTINAGQSVSLLSPSGS